ncbi:BTB/POZ domain-containing protein 6-like [Gigantopelta aegis]|uniref:BTB/POZ domain-containing protein 6-like n=1 Tax=Gigantopelta aegis TaxID=1735272 RepID=UPI001B88A6F2|nr:BTB/POZ domain-containing protein 6-like [Gigantopelta aegis]
MTSQKQRKQTPRVGARALGVTEDWLSRRYLAETNLHMLGKNIVCDVTFRVGPTREIIQAHKFMLISRSHVFAAMFNGPFAETGEVYITDVDVNIFNLFLRFLYTDYINVNSDSVMHLLYLAKKYSTGKLEDMCLKFLETSLNANNSDDLQADEKEVFQAAFEWAKHQCENKHVAINTETLRTQLGDIVHQVRFPLLDRQFFVRTVNPSGLQTDKEQRRRVSMSIILHTEKSRQDKELI